MELKEGHIYIISGMGEMKLLKKLPVTETLTLETSTGSKYYARPEEVVKEAIEKDIKARKKEMRSRRLFREAELLQKLWDGRRINDDR